MDKDEAVKVCNRYGRPSFETDDGKTISLARTDGETVEWIEDMGDDELLDAAKGSWFTLNVAGQVSLYDLQVAELYQLEMQERDIFDKFKEFKTRVEEIKQIGKERLGHLDDEEVILRTVDLIEIDADINSHEEQWPRKKEGKDMIEVHFQEITRRDIFWDYVAEIDERGLVDN